MVETVAGMKITKVVFGSVGLANLANPRFMTHDVASVKGSSGKLEAKDTD